MTRFLPLADVLVRGSSSFESCRSPWYPTAIRISNLETDLQTKIENGHKTNRIDGGMNCMGEGGAKLIEASVLCQANCQGDGDAILIEDSALGQANCQGEGDAKPIEDSALSQANCQGEGDATPIEDSALGPANCQGKGEAKASEDPELGQAKDGAEQELSGPKEFSFSGLLSSEYLSLEEETASPGSFSKTGISPSQGPSAQQKGLGVVPVPGGWVDTVPSMAASPPMSRSPSFPNSHRAASSRNLLSGTGSQRQKESGLPSLPDSRRAASSRNLLSGTGSQRQMESGLPSFQDTLWPASSPGRNLLSGMGSQRQKESGLPSFPDSRRAASSRNLLSGMGSQRQMESRLPSLQETLRPASSPGRNLLSGTGSQRQMESGLPSFPDTLRPASSSGRNLPSAAGSPRPKESGRLSGRLSGPMVGMSSSSERRVHGGVSMVGRASGSNLSFPNSPRMEQLTAGPRSLSLTPKTASMFAVLASAYFSNHSTSESPVRRRKGVRTREAIGGTMGRKPRKSLDSTASKALYDATRAYSKSFFNISIFQHERIFLSRASVASESSQVMTLSGQLPPCTPAPQWSSFFDATETNPRVPFLPVQLTIRQL
eukprot:gene16957-23233_t